MMAKVITKLADIHMHNDGRTSMAHWQGVGVGFFTDQRDS